jgi:hypothetical protein
MTVRGLARRLESFGFGGIDPLRLQVFRALFAMTLLVYMADRAQTPYEWLTWEGFHVSPEFSRGYRWRPPLLPTSWVVPFLGLYFASVVALIVGWKTRVTTWLVLGCTAYVTSADAQSAYSMNNMYLFGLLALALAPAPRSFSENGVTVSRQSAWPVRVLQATLVVQYFAAGACKAIHGDWLQVDGEWALNHDVLWTHVQGVYCTDIGAWMLRTLPRWSWSAQQQLALTFELGGPFLFLFRRTRPFVLLWGLGFHAAIGLTMHKVGYFSLQMLAYYVLFFSPALLRRVLPARV